MRNVRVVWNTDQEIEVFVHQYSDEKSGWEWNSVWKGDWRAVELLRELDDAGALWGLEEVSE